jgi:hypothetical protein
MAILTTIVSPGSHAVTAVYRGTAASPKVVRSKLVALKVTGKTGSTTVLTAKANAAIFTAPRNMAAPTADMEACSSWIRKAS